MSNHNGDRKKVFSFRTFFIRFLIHHYHHRDLLTCLVSPFRGLEGIYLNVNLTMHIHVDLLNSLLWAVIKSIYSNCISFNISISCIHLFLWSLDLHFSFGHLTVGILKGHSQCWDCADLNTSFYYFEKHLLQPEINIVCGQCICLKSVSIVLGFHLILSLLYNL